MTVREDEVTTFGGVFIFSVFTAVANGSHAQPEDEAAGGFAV
jgi:hypothetical protein